MINASEVTEMTIALLEPTLRNSCGLSNTGTRTDSINSPCTKDVCFTPTIRSSKEIALLPSELLSETSAPNAERTGIISPAGEAVPIFPPIVPAFRICGDPTVRAAWAKAGTSVARGPRSISRYVTQAPITTESPSWCQFRSSGTRSIAMTLDGDLCL